MAGAYQEDENTAGGSTPSNAGSAYVFVRDGSTWSQQQKLMASDRAVFNRFGHSVALSGDYLLVGAQMGVDAGNAGRAYVFVRTGSTWSQQQRLVPAERAADDYFGYSVALNGDYAVVGAYGEDQDAADGTLSNAGSAYLFGPAAPLPVTLTGFTAVPAPPAAVALAWTTALEQHSAHFAVERSLDGQRFAALGQVVAAGTSSRARAYNFRDAALPVGASVLYYRLRQVDQDGSYSYSPVRTVALSAAGDGLTLAPNPRRTQTTLRGAEPGAAVRVYGVRGRLVLTAAADAAGTAELRLPAQLPAGVYLVRSGARAVRLLVE